jgi:hypothetical protein
MLRLPCLIQRILISLSYFRLDSEVNEPMYGRFPELPRRNRG